MGSISERIQTQLMNALLVFLAIEKKALFVAGCVAVCAAAYAEPARAEAAKAAWFSFSPWGDSLWKPAIAWTAVRGATVLYVDYFPRKFRYYE